MSNNLATQYLEELKQKITRIKSVIECIESELSVANNPSIGHLLAKKIVNNNLEPSGNNSPFQTKQNKPEIKIPEDDRIIIERVHSSERKEPEDPKRILEKIAEEKRIREKQTKRRVAEKCKRKTDRRTQYQSTKKTFIVELLKSTNRITTSSEIRNFLIYRLGRKLTYADICYSLNALVKEGLVQKVGLGRWQLKN